MPTQMIQTNQRSLEWIAVKNLSTLWVKAQRPFRDSWCQEIADNLDPDKLGVIAVTLPNGNGIYHIVDGQHRAGAVRVAWGDSQMVPCFILNAQNPQRAAEIWLGLNKTKKAHPVDHFNLRVEAGETDAVEIHETMTRLGFGFDHRNHVSEESGKVYVSAVEALSWIYKNHSMTVLENTVALITRLWKGDPLSYEAATLKAFGQFCGEHRGHYHHERLVGKLKRKWSGWSQFKQEYREKAPQLDLPGWQAGYQRIVTHYNAGLPRKERLAP